MSYIERSDDELLTTLRSAAVLMDPVPASVVAAARASFVFASLSDMTEAELVFDSAWDNHESRALVRSSGGTRELSFEGGGTAIEIEISPVPGRHGLRRIVGQVVPAAPADLEIRHPSGSTAVAADGLGRFLVDATPGGPVSLTCRHRGAPPVVTEWIVI